MLEIKQMRQKANWDLLLELSQKVRFMLSGSKVRWHRNNTVRDAAHHCNKKIHVAKSQLKLHLARTMGNKKSVFKRISIKTVF